MSKQAALIAPSKIAIIGTGLIGGSIAASFRRVFPSTHISGFAQANDASVALQLGLIDEASASVQACCADAEIVFVTCPVGAMSEVFLALAQTPDRFGTSAPPARRRPERTGLGSVTPAVPNARLVNGGSRFCGKDKG